MITLDTSAIVALISTSDRHHGAARGRIAESPETVVPAAILSEVAWVVGKSVGEHGSRNFLQGVIEGSTFLDCGDGDLPRILDLMVRFGDLHLGFSVAAVIACAERNGGDVLTFDRHDFEFVAQDVPINLVP